MHIFQSILNYAAEFSNTTFHEREKRVLSTRQQSASPSPAVPRSSFSSRGPVRGSNLHLGTPNSEPPASTPRRTPKTAREPLGTPFLTPRTSGPPIGLPTPKMTPGRPPIGLGDPIFENSKVRGTPTPRRKTLFFEHPKFRLFSTRTPKFDPRTPKIDPGTPKIGLPLSPLVQRLPDPFLVIFSTPSVQEGGRHVFLTNARRKTIGVLNTPRRAGPPARGWLLGAPLRPPYSWRRRMSCIQNFRVSEKFAVDARNDREKHFFR